jgi:hypothetical protein
MEAPLLLLLPFVALHDSPAILYPSIQGPLAGIS